MMHIKKTMLFLYSSTQGRVIEFPFKANSLFFISVFYSPKLQMTHFKRTHKVENTEQTKANTLWQIIISHHLFFSLPLTNDLL